MVPKNGKKRWEIFVENSESTYFPLIHMGSITALRCATARINSFQIATDKIFSQYITKSKDNFVRIGGLRRI